MPWPKGRPRPEAGEWMARANRGRKRSPEHCKNIRQAKLGKPNLKLRGRKRPPEVGRKISMAKKGVPNPKLAQALRGRTLHPDHIEKLCRYQRTPKAQAARVRTQKALRTPVESGKQCPICLVHFESLVQDHDHTTGLMRGVVCSACNTGLGFFRDNMDSLRRAAEYIKQYSQQPQEMSM